MLRKFSCQLYDTFDIDHVLLSLSLSLALSEQDCLRLFSMSEDIIEGIFSIISSVLHLGNVHYVADGDKASYKDARSSMMNEKYSCDKQIPAH
jgi:hypothetical protein